MKARIAGAWPLWSVLTAQLVLTLPWLWRTAPFTDEALYLDAGHQEWASWLGHAAMPDYASWFSGSPALYPPLAAAADSAGGLAAARALSLVVMLATTALVYLIGEQLFGRLAGILGAFLFAVCGLVVHYGAFATFGPLALFFLTLAAWSAIRVGAGSMWWLPAAALTLVAANATKYATLAWDPVIIAIIVLRGWGGARWPAIVQAASAAVTVAVLDLGLVMLGGAEYARGVIFTTVFRTIRWGAPSPAGSVLAHALAMTGLIVLPAIGGVAVSIATRMPLTTSCLLGVLVVAAVLAPVEQARIHELASLDKNLGFGLPFAAVAAGYVLSTGVTQRRARVRLGAITAASGLVVAVLVTGRLQSVQFRGPGITVADQVVATIGRGYVPGTFILSDSAARMERYYLPAISSEHWLAAFSPSPAQSLQIADMVCASQVSVVVLRRRGHAYDHPYDRDHRRHDGPHPAALQAGHRRPSGRLRHAGMDGHRAGLAHRGCR